MTIATTKGTRSTSAKATKAADATEIVDAEIITDEVTTDEVTTDEVTTDEAPKAIDISKWNPIQPHEIKIVTSDVVLLQALRAVEAMPRNLDTTPIFTVDPLKWNQSDVILAMFDGIADGTIAYASHRDMGLAMNRITGGTSKTPEGRVSQVSVANRNRPSVRHYVEFAATHKAYVDAVETIKANAAAMEKLGVPAETIDKIVSDALAALDAPRHVAPKAAIAS